MAPVELTRAADSSSRLIALVNDWRSRPYVYGVTDCWQFALAAVRCQTGVDLMPGVVWPRSLFGAVRIMIENGWENINDAMNALLPSQSVEDARPGDVVSFERGGEHHMAVRVGDTALTPDLRGLMAIDRALWRRAWRVG